MYQPNDTVCYGLNGPCKILSLAVREFGGAKREYYVLHPLYSGTDTLFVPVDNDALTAKMRPALSAEDARALIAQMPEADPLWFEDEQERKRQYRALLSEGDPRQLVRVIKALYLHGRGLLAKGRKPHAADDQLFHMAEKVLYGEFAFALGVAPEGVVSYIERTLADAGESA